MYFELLLWSMFFNMLLGMGWMKCRAKLNATEACFYLQVSRHASKKVIMRDPNVKESLEFLQNRFPALAPECETALAVLRMKKTPHGVDIRKLLHNVVHEYQNI